MDEVSGSAPSGDPGLRSPTEGPRNDEDAPRVLFGSSSSESHFSACHLV